MPGGFKRCFYRNTHAGETTVGVNFDFNGTTPVMVLHRTSKLNWDEYISDQLLPLPLSFLEDCLPMTEAREWLVDGHVNHLASLG